MKTKKLLKGFVWLTLFTFLGLLALISVHLNVWTAAQTISHYRLPLMLLRFLALGLFYFSWPKFVEKAAKKQGWDDKVKLNVMRFRTYVAAFFLIFEMIIVQNLPDRIITLIHLI